MSEDPVLYCRTCTTTISPRFREEHERQGHTVDAYDSESPEAQYLRDR